MYKFIDIVTSVWYFWYFKEGAFRLKMSKIAKVYFLTAFAILILLLGYMLGSGKNDLFLLSLTLVNTLMVIAVAIDLYNLGGEKDEK